MALLSRERYSEVDIIVCDATPEGDIAAPAGSMALSTEGILYTKASGAGNAGWVAAKDNVYVAEISQIGTNDPVVTEKRNTYGETATWTRVTNGEFELNLIGVAAGTSSVSICNGGSGAPVFLNVFFTGDNTLLVYSIDRLTGANTDGLLAAATIVITTPIA